MDYKEIPHITLRQLAYLVSAVDGGTISSAAGKLHVSASAVSDSITELEQIMGTRLCVRRRAQGLTLTNAGARVVRQARPILAEARELGASLLAEEGELVGPLTIGCYPTLAPIVLPPLLCAFGKRNPKVELQIFEGTHNQIVEHLESGDVDVGFVYDTLIPGYVQRQRLYELPAHVLLAAEDKLSIRPSVQLEELVDQDLIMLDVPPSAHHTLSMFSARNLTPHIRHRTSSYEVVRTLVGRGLGYGILVQRPKIPTSYEGYPLVIVNGQLN